MCFTQFVPFLDSNSHLFMRVCPSVSPSVCVTLWCQAKTWKIEKFEALKIYRTLKGHGVGSNEGRSVSLFSSLYYMDYLSIISLTPRHLLPRFQRNRSHLSSQASLTIRSWLAKFAISNILVQNYRKSGLGNVFWWIGIFDCMFVWPWWLKVNHQNGCWNFKMRVEISKWELKNDQKLESVTT